ncbi:hypothetical protein L484_010684 [Morus notabilis]|uniref:Uncharacterized protein n=1 Tax=Morus notabilis TaxID=981085 RepID=W9S7R9_9ROSA|nr:hypothetical protein L484_010684 [Morus notabilis]
MSGVYTAKASWRNPILGPIIQNAVVYDLVPHNRTTLGRLRFNQDSPKGNQSVAPFKCLWDA